MNFWEYEQGTHGASITRAHSMREYVLCSVTPGPKALTQIWMPVKGCVVLCNILHSSELQSHLKMIMINSTYLNFTGKIDRLASNLQGMEIRNYQMIL